MQDIYAKFSEALGSLTPTQATQFNSKRKPGMTVETQLNVIESITGVSLTKSVKESKPIPKNNGRLEEFRESRFITEVAPEVKRGRELREASDLLMYKGLGISEADQRRLQGKGPAGLTEHQESEYRFGRAIGLNESEALTMCKK